MSEKRAYRPLQLLLSVPVILALVLVEFPSDRTACAETIRIGGVGGALGTMRILAAEFGKNHPGDRIVVLPSLGSGGGIKAVLSGAIQIGLSTRPLTESEQKDGAVQKVCARTPFVFASGTQAGQDDFTISQIADMYSGRVKAWPGGKPVRVVLRPAGDGDTALIKSISAEMEAAVQAALPHPGMIFAITDQDSADSIEKVPGAIGTSTIAQIISEERRIKAFSINGVAPNLETISDGTYPYSKTLYIITPRKPAPLAGEFVKFIFSPAGSRILRKSGFLAVIR